MELLFRCSTLGGQFRFQRKHHFNCDITSSILETQAKILFRDILNKEYGYDAESIQKNGCESDLKATDKNNNIFYFELKSTTKENYFGSASFTEWKKAFENPESYFFVVAYFHDDVFSFTEYSVPSFLQFCTITPLKVYFNVNVKTGEGKNITGKTVRLTNKNFVLLKKTYDSIKTQQK